MAKREFGHRVGKNGRVERVETTLPKHLRGYDEYSIHTFTEGPLARLLGRKKR
jgi:hypothetical protein